MEINIWLLVIGGLAVLFFGYFFGLFEGRDQGFKKGQAEAKPDETTEIPVNAQPASEASPTTPRSEFPGLLRLREADGRLGLELDGAELNAESLTVSQRKRLIEVVARLRPWIEPPAAAPAAETPPAPPVPAAVRTASLTRPAAPPVPVPAEPPAAVNSMVGQIDEILQQKIEGSSLAERGLRLVEEPGGGVAVLIGRERFASMGEVTDPEVQAALRAAVSLWEKKYTPGA